MGVKKAVVAAVGGHRRLPTPLPAIGAGPSSMASLSPLQLSSRQAVDEWLQSHTISFLEQLLDVALPDAPLADVFSSLWLLVGAGALSPCGLDRVPLQYAHLKSGGDVQPGW